MRTCGTCGTAGQPDTAKFCLECGSPMAVEPTCASCGEDLPPVGKFCPNCGAPRAGVQAAAPPTQPAAEVPQPRGAARKITSVLFGDLVGFTTLSESRDAEEVRELLTAYFDDCRAIVGRYGGELEKFIGDAVMAVWGLPVTREDDAERAVRAGIELVAAVTALGDRIGMPGLSMRVGITTAEVAVTLGATGQGMVAGDPVNTAARIQSTANPGEVWVDETTRNFASSAIGFEDAGSHAMKGKAEPVPLWKVSAVMAGIGGDRRDDGLEAQLVGRDGELRLVKEFFHRVQDTLRPGMLIVDGEPGIGKSRLGWEFEKYVDGFEASVLWHRGRCLSYGEGVAYYALAEAVRGRLAVLAGAGGDAEAGADARQLLRQGVAACVPDPAEREWLEPGLAALLGNVPGASFTREDLFVAWTTFFKYVGQWQSDVQQPVVLVIDDAQHADGGLLAFLEHLLSAADFPIFVLALARTELLAENPQLLGNRRVTVVHLEPLTGDEMARLVDHLVAGVPESLRGELAARAEGIPLYAIETVRSLIDQHLVARRDGRFTLTDPGAVDVAALTAPASLQALIAARLDTLPADERKVVDRASVLGLVFSMEGLSALCADVPDVQGAIAGLVRREVLRRETDRLSADFGDYRFVQGAVRQVAYGMLSRRDRKATHLTVARAFEAELESRSDAYELAPIIAQHYLDAIDAVPADPDVPELTKIASDHLERAAERAAGLGAPREAAAYLAQALARCEPERRLQIQSRLARQLRISGDYEGAIEHAAEALKGYEVLGDMLAAAEPAEDLARALTYSEGDLSRARRVARDYFDRIPDEPENLLARHTLLNALGAVLLRAGDPDEYQRVCYDVLLLAERTGDPRRIADAWNGFAISTQHVMPTLSAMMMRQAAVLAKEHRALRAHCLALLNLGAGMVLADIRETIRTDREATAAARDLGEPYLLTGALVNLGFALVLAGEWEEGLELSGLQEVRDAVTVTADVILRLAALARDQELPSVTDSLGTDPESMAEDRLWLAEYDIDRALEAQATGAPGAAGLAVSGARGASEVAGSGADFWPQWLVAADIAIAEGDPEAMRALLELVDIRRGPWPVGMRAQHQRLSAVAAAGDGSRPDVVEAQLRNALELTQAWGSPLYEAHVSADLGRWLRDQGRPDEAAVLLDSAREFYASVGARRWIDELEPVAR